MAGKFFPRLYSASFMKFHTDDNTCHYPDLGTGNSSDWSCREENLLQPIRSTMQSLVVIRLQYGISVLVPQVSFREETSSGITKCWLFS